MQDDATPLTANAILEYLKQKLGDRMISRKTIYPWAAHSPDRNPPDFFVWGYAKDHECADKRRTLQKLKSAIIRLQEAITRFINAISADLCKRVIGNYAIRLNECLYRRGGHIEHAL